MQFIVRAFDGAGALERRMAARAAHLEAGESLTKAGKLLFAVAMLDDAGKMIGSVVVFNVADRAELDGILEREPYVVQNVWETIEVTGCRVAPFCAPR